MARTSDLLGWLSGVCKGPLLRLRVDIEPKPTPRPRVSKWGAYFPKEYEAYRAELQRQLAVQVGQRLTEEAHEAGLLDGALAVVIDVACTKPRTGKLAHPRGDVDNFAKGPLDAATKVGLWHDDTQVASLTVAKRYREADEAAGIGLWVGRLT